MVDLDGFSNDGELAEQLPHNLSPGYGQAGVGIHSGMFSAGRCAADGLGGIDRPGSSAIDTYECGADLYVGLVVKVGVRHVVRDVELLLAISAIDRPPLGLPPAGCRAGIN